MAGIALLWYNPTLMVTLAYVNQGFGHTEGARSASSHYYLGPCGRDRGTSLISLPKNASFVLFSRQSRTATVILWPSIWCRFPSFVVLRLLHVVSHIYWTPNHTPGLWEVMVNRMSPLNFHSNEKKLITVEWVSTKDTQWEVWFSLRA